MGPPSAAPHGGHRPWQGLLITASLLTFWDPPTTVQFTIEAMPSSAAEGQDVLLPACNISETIQAYYWHKGKTAEGSPLVAGYITDIQANIPGVAHTGRERVYSNGSLLFQNITLEDAGPYTLRTIDSNYDSDQATGQLHVHRPAPSVTSGSSSPQPPPPAMVPLTDPPSRSPYPAPEQPLPSMRNCYTLMQTVTAGLTAKQMWSLRLWQLSRSCSCGLMEVPKAPSPGTGKYMEPEPENQL
ncbi:carcinoembryonic antigen-related cell adhesion molecule 4 isoform X4 [Nomascus leucogenys]|uniref:carcinoembryonic antigen-related cell adhesion molecule 4 isoform X4 n=1 Tax=Nomascus leucogenys TaxID=61853 RepID=UPI00122D5231|nr:carcinoembryonic antigen-related cell adhesion molecule 4 isoform X4 [Nomascus leucogenys]